MQIPTFFSKFWHRVQNLINNRPVLAAGLVFAIFALVFIGKGIILPGHFGPGDAIRVTQPFITEGHWPSTTIFGDVIFQFLPWFKLSKDIIAQGDFPLWNTYSGMGLPLLANMQSAIFFPLSWLFFLFGIKFGLLASAFIKLWVIGFFTFLFLREKRLTFYSSLVGATGFMFAGSNVLWLLWPLVGVTMLLPAGMFLIERYFNSRNNIYLLLFSIALMLGVFAGHPETLFMICFSLGAYFLFMSFRKNDFWLSRIGEWIKFGVSSVIGVALAAVSLVPFLEYLILSAAFAHRQVENTNYLPKVYSITNFIPDFFGNLSSSGFSYVVYPNYSEISLGYVGITLMLLALLALLFNYREKIVLFFAGLAGFSLILIYNVSPFYGWLTKLPGFSANFNSRFLIIWAFCIVVMGAYALELLLKRQITRRQVLIGAAILLAAVSIIFTYAYFHTRTWDISGHSWQTVTLWQWAFFGVFLANLLLATVTFLFLHDRRLKAVILTLVLIETMVHAINYNHVSKPGDFYPETGITSYLRDNFPKGYYRTFPQGHIILPSLSTWYGFNQINDYDAIYIQKGKELKAHIGPINGTPEYTHASPHFDALEFMGVKYLVFTSEAGRAIVQNNPSRFAVAYDNGTNIILEQDALPRAYGIQASSVEEAGEKLQQLMRTGDRTELFLVTDYMLRTNGESSLSYSFPENTFLVFNEIYYPDWKVVIDGNQVIPTSEAFYLKVAPVPAGEHTATTDYQPRSFKIGGLISLASLVVWLGFLVVVLLQNRKRKQA